MRGDSPTESVKNLKHLLQNGRDNGGAITPIDENTMFIVSGIDERSCCNRHHRSFPQKDLVTN